LKIGL
jgi:hypothetical protein